MAASLEGDDGAISGDGGGPVLAPCSKLGGTGKRGGLGGSGGGGGKSTATEAALYVARNVASNAEGTPDMSAEAN
eukprot:366301-Chlamydomonas_euryale.AAC.17